MASSPSVPPPGHKAIRLTSKPFTSLPLFLPSNYSYDAATNAVVQKKKQPSKDGDDENNDDETEGLFLVPNAGMEMLEQMETYTASSNNNNNNGGVSAIACLGPYRTGKSLLMSRFIFPVEDNNNDKNDTSTTSTPTTTSTTTPTTTQTAATAATFDIGPTMEGCTRGIWISTTGLQCSKTNTIKLLLDCEGMGDPNIQQSSSQKHDIRIAMTCLLISGVFLFNNTSHPNRSSLQFLQCLQTLRQRLPRSSRRAVDFPSFVWVFRDSFLQLPSRNNSSSGGSDGKENDTYTLKEYMEERILAPCQNSNSNNHYGASSDSEIADSLLNDFASFHAFTVRYPARQGGISLTTHEVAHLGEVPYPELDEEFRREMQTVVDQCLEEAKPFQLAETTTAGDNDNDDNTRSEDKDKTALADTTNNSKSKANHKKKKGFMGLFHNNKKNKEESSSKARQFPNGALYAKWLKTVVDLVNSETVIPNLPDIQHQLVQELADTKVQELVARYEQIMEGFINDSPVFGSTDGKHWELEELLERQPLKGVAQAETLLQKSQDCAEVFQGELETVLPNGSILQEAWTTLEKQTTDASNKTSSLSLWLVENQTRSQISCDALSSHMYAPLQTRVRKSDPTIMSVSEFQTSFEELLTRFQNRARGPAVDMVVERFWKPKRDDDLVFLQKLSESNLRFEKAKAKGEELQSEVEARALEVAKMAKDLELTKQQTQEEMAALKVQHDRRMAQALEDQNRKAEANLASLQADMNQKVKDAESRVEQGQQERAAEIKRLKAETESLVATQVAAHNEKIRQEQQAHEVQLASLQAQADQILKAKMEEAAANSKLEQANLEETMKSQLQEVEEAKQRDLSDKEKLLAEKQRQLEIKEFEKKALQKRAEEAEDRFTCQVCCIL